MAYNNTLLRLLYGRPDRFCGTPINVGVNHGFCHSEASTSLIFLMISSVYFSRAGFMLLFIKSAQGNPQIFSLWEELNHLSFFC